MKITLRTQSMLLIVPLGIALAILLVIALIPYFLVHDDIAGVEKDLDTTLAILRFSAAFTDQHREYADLLVVGNEEQAGDISRAAAAGRLALADWRRLAGENSPHERETLRRIEAEQASLIAAGDRIVALHAQGRYDDAVNLLFREVRPRADRIAAMTSETLLEREQNMSRSVARITGGVRYSELLAFADLQEGVADLDAQVSEMIASAGLANALESEVAAYWHAYLSGSPTFGADAAVARDRAERFFRTWRAALLESANARERGGPKQHAELAFLDGVHRDYRIMEANGDRVLALVESGSMPEARAVLVRFMEFDEMKAARSLQNYVSRESDIVRQKLDFLRRQTARVLLFLALFGAIALIAGFGAVWLLSRGMIGPIVDLKTAAERIGKGDFDARVPVPMVSELAALATTFNGMTDDLQRSREELRRSRERFALVARATSDVIWDLDVATGTARVSGRDADDFGFSRDEAVSADVWIDAVHPDDREEVLREFDRALATPMRHWEYEYRYRRNTGGYAYVADRGYIVRDEDHKPVRVIGSMTDVTERKTAEQALTALSRQNEMILDSVGEGILGVDAAGNIISANPAAAAMLGRRAERLVGEPLGNVIRFQGRNTPSLPPEDSPISATRERGTRETGEGHLFTREDGSTFPADFTINPMIDAGGGVIGAVMAFRDVTEKFEVDRLKAEFVSTVSHELRTPLTSIRGSLGLLSGGLLGSLSPQGQRMLEIAVANTDRLVRLINDILDIERLDSGALTLNTAPVDVADLMQQAADVMKPMADAAGVAMLCSPFRGTIAADHDRMMQTLTNLLSNAIKFSPAGTTISMSAVREGPMLLFRIADQGRGIPPAKLGAIFERFQQVDASDSRDKGGTGLGLPICRRIVQQHGGTMWVESAVGQGSTFFFTIPLAGEPAGSGQVCSAAAT